MILDDILVQTRKALEARKQQVPLEGLAQAAAALPPTRGLARSLSRQGRAPGTLGCIAEIKRRSPSAGWIREGADAVDIANRYTAAGASAISVLTDQPFFGGTLEDLRAVRAAVTTPLLRKDFIVDAYQIYEARTAGADAILLIVAALDDRTLHTLSDVAADVGLDVLVETHDEDEIRRAVALGASLIGINHRDLRTFTVDTSLATRMRDQIPAETTVVAESGLKTADDLDRMVAGGIDAILVGESLMRASDPGAALHSLWGKARPT